MFWYDATYFLLIPAILFTLFAQAKVKMNFNKYSKVRNNKNITGFEAARRVLDANGLRDVGIEAVAGNLTDHYDPRTRVLRLSESVYAAPSIAAVSVACHEVGHAIQHATSYGPLKLRNTIVPIVNFASTLSWPMAIIGIILLPKERVIGDTLFNVGVIMFMAVILFHLITLPVEFNASSRAIQEMNELGIINSDEITGTKKVLNAAAMTYVAALAMAVLNLIRLFAMRGRND